MTTKRTPAAASVSAAKSVCNPRSCDAFAIRGITREQQAQIAAAAYELWLARAFRNGSPQEDWLLAQRQVQRRRQRRLSAGGSLAGA